MYRANFTCDYSFKVYGCYSQEEKFCVIKSRSGGSSLKMRWWQWRGADTYCGNPMDNQRLHGRGVTPCDRYGWAGGLHPGRAGSTPPPPASAAAAAPAPCQVAGFQHKH